MAEFSLAATSGTMSPGPNGKSAQGVFLLDPLTGMPTLPVDSDATPSALYSGQASIATTGVAVRLSASSVPIAKCVHITANALNIGSMTVGGAGVSSSTGYILAPGASVDISINNINLVYVNGTLGNACSWVAS